MASQRLTLTDLDRQLLSQTNLTESGRRSLADLYQPFEETYRRHHSAGWSPQNSPATVQESFRFCGRMMLEMNCTYWAFDWPRLIAWKAAITEKNSHRLKTWHIGWRLRWSRVTSTLYFLGAITYSEEIHGTFYRRIGERWLGKDEAQSIEERFTAAALSVGYKHKDTIREKAVAVLLVILLFTRKKDIADIRVKDLEDWRAQTRRSKRVAAEGISCIRVVLSSMGLLGGEALRVSMSQGTKFDWGRTAPEIIPSFERFLADIKPVRVPASVTTYRVGIRRFGDWLGLHHPDVKLLADLRREHIEAYKRAVMEMRCGDHVSFGNESRTANFGELLSRAHQIRMLSCVKVFCEHAETLEYSDRPARKLWMRGDMPQEIKELPRSIPEADWRLLSEAFESLTPETAEECGMTVPFERTRAILAVLFESGLRADELCRLDLGCLLSTRDLNSDEETHWIRVPVGKGNDDRMIPVRPQLVEAVDAWIRVRGKQPAVLDKRTGKQRDMLFTWLGRLLSNYSLNLLIEQLCTKAGTGRRYTSHQFRHTLAVLWRSKGMRIETISRMLGHKSLTMTMRYAAIMPPLLRQEFEAAFAAVDEEHRATAKVRVILSPEAHLEAQVQWRESLFVDLGIGWCGLSAYYPCEARLACPGCSNFIPDKESLPLLERQRSNLVELRGLGERVLGGARKADLERELNGAINGLDRNIDHVKGGKKNKDDD